MFGFGSKVLPLSADNHTPWEAALWPLVVLCRNRSLYNKTLLFMHRQMLIMNWVLSDSPSHIVWYSIIKWKFYICDWVELFQVTSMTIDVVPKISCSHSSFIVFYSAGYSMLYALIIWQWERGPDAQVVLPHLNVHIRTFTLPRNMSTWQWSLVAISGG